MTLYMLLKWLHIVLTVVALGTNFTYGFWIRRAGQTPEMLPFTLAGIRALDTRLANPAYAVILITGIGMALIGPFRFETPWILISIVLYAVVFLVAILGYTPALKRQIGLVQNPGPDSEAYALAARRANLLMAAIIFLVVVIVSLMVTKPVLWG